MKTRYLANTFTPPLGPFIQSGRTIVAIRLDGWRSREFASRTADGCVIRCIDVGCPEDRDRAANANRLVTCRIGQAIPRTSIRTTATTALVTDWTQ